MASPSRSIDDVSLEAMVLPVGQVATMLGIPTMTLRSWETRYDLKPAGRTAGLHRRYTLADIDRLRRMMRLMAAGVSTRDAARLSAHPHTAEAEADGTAGQIVEIAEALALGDLAELLDVTLSTWGAADAWTELIAPAFRALESRFERQSDCTDIELILAGSVEAAVERYVTRRELRLGGSHPVLLVHCPEERHTLPLTMLRAVLLERSQPVVLLGPDTTEAAILQAVTRALPGAAVLWASTPRPGQLRLRNLVTATGFPTLTAGPGWPPSAKPLADLRTAADTLTVSRSDHSGKRVSQA